MSRKSDGRPLKFPSGKSLNKQARGELIEKIDRAYSELLCPVNWKQVGNRVYYPHAIRQGITYFVLYWLDYHERQIVVHEARRKRMPPDEFKSLIQPLIEHHKVIRNWLVDLGVPIMTVDADRHNDMIGIGFTPPDEESDNAEA